MKVFEIKHVKDFMSKLRLTDLFDHFLLSEATICGKVTYVIDGRLTKDFWTTAELDTNGLSDSVYAPFSLLRTNCYDLIKGKKTPSSFRFVFLLSPENLANTIASSNSGFSPENLSAAFLNIKYLNGQLTCTTGISYKTFSLDHSFEQYWDTLAARFLGNHGIDFDEPA